MEAKKKCAGTLLAFLMSETVFLSATTPISVAESSPQTPSAVSENDNDHKATCTSYGNDDYRNSVSLIDPYIEVKGGRLVSTIPDTVKNQIPSKIYESLMASLSEANTLISEGRLDVNAVDPRYGKTRDAGANEVTLHWWGVSLKMSNDVFNKVSRAVAAGGGAAFIAGVFLDSTGIGLPAGISLDVLGGIIMAGVAIMQPCNWNDRGVGLHHAWVGPAWCWPQ